MNAAQVIQTIFEAVLFAAVILGFIYENKLIELEKRIANKWRARK